MVGAAVITRARQSSRFMQGYQQAAHKYFSMKLSNIGVGNDDSEHEVEQESRDSKQDSHRRRLRSRHQTQGHCQMTSKL